MRLLFQNHNDVALQHVRYLLSLALIDYLLAISHTFHDVNNELFLLHDNLATAALTTVLLVCAALTAAFVTRLLHLNLHEAHVLKHLDLSLALALRASLGFAAFGAGALALFAVDIPVYVKVLGGSHIELFETHREINLVLGSFHALITAALVALNLVFALLVVDLPLLIVGEHLVRSVDFGELLSCFFITYKHVGTKQRLAMQN